MDWLVLILREINPFLPRRSPTTHLRFALPSVPQKHLVVGEALGKETWSLVSEEPGVPPSSASSPKTSYNFRALPRLLRSGWWSCWLFQSKCPDEGYKLPRCRRLPGQQNRDWKLDLLRHTEVRLQLPRTLQLLAPSLMQLQPTSPEERGREEKIKQTAMRLTSPDSPE